MGWRPFSVVQVLDLQSEVAVVVLVLVLLKELLDPGVVPVVEFLDPIITGVRVLLDQDWGTDDGGDGAPPGKLQEPAGADEVGEGHLEDVEEEPGEEGDLDGVKDLGLAKGVDGNDGGAVLESHLNKALVLGVQLDDLGGGLGKPQLGDTTRDHDGRVTLLEGLLKGSSVNMAGAAPHGEVANERRVVEDGGAKSNRVDVGEKLLPLLVAGHPEGGERLEKRQGQEEVS